MPQNYHNPVYYPQRPQAPRLEDGAVIYPSYAPKTKYTQESIDSVIESVNRLGLEKPSSFNVYDLKSALESLNEPETSKTIEDVIGEYFQDRPYEPQFADFLRKNIKVDESGEEVLSDKWQDLLDETFLEESIEAALNEETEVQELIEQISGAPSIRRPPSVRRTGSAGSVNPIRRLPSRSRTAPYSPQTDAAAVDLLVRTPLIPPVGTKYCGELSGLRNEGNSCYMDSLLFALFIPQSFYIEDWLDRTLLDFFSLDKLHNGTPESIQRRVSPGKCAIRGEEDIDYRNRLAIRNELVQIRAKFFSGDSDVGTCANLRALLAQCQGGADFAYGNLEDPNSLLSFLMDVLSVPDEIRVQKDIWTSNSTDPQPPPDQLTHVDERSGVHQRPPIINVEPGLIPPNKSIIINLYKTTNYVLPAARQGEYSRIFDVENVLYAKYLIFSIHRQSGSYGGEVTDEFNQTSVIPSPIIYLQPNEDSDQLLFKLVSAVLYTGANHYVAVAQCEDAWYFYDDTLANKVEVIPGATTWDAATEYLLSKGMDPRTNGVLYCYDLIEGQI